MECILYLMPWTGERVLGAQLGFISRHKVRIIVALILTPVVLSSCSLCVCLTHCHCRFWDHSGVMSMACWSLVNISLVDRHKVIMLQLGAVQKVLAAIRKHPDCQEVVYRALFCLVNFVVPAGATNNQSQGTSSAAVSVHMNLSVKPASVGGQLEDILKTTIFCIFKWIHNTDIISRATLIFHNLSVIENSERGKRWNRRLHSRRYYQAFNSYGTNPLQSHYPILCEHSCQPSSSRLAA